MKEIREYVIRKGSIVSVLHYIINKMYWIHSITNLKCLLKEERVIIITFAIIKAGCPIKNFEMQSPYLFSRRTKEKINTMIIDDANDFKIRNKPNHLLTLSPVNIIATTLRFD